MVSNMLTLALGALASTAVARRSLVTSSEVQYGRQLLDHTDDDDDSRYGSYGGYGYGGMGPRMMEEMAMRSPEEDVRAVSPSPEEEVMAVSPSPEEDVMAVSPSPEEDVMAVSPSPEEEVMAVSPSPEEDVMAVSPSPEEEVEASPSPEEEVEASPSPSPSPEVMAESPSPEVSAESPYPIGEMSIIPGCMIDHVLEGSPGCEQCLPGFYKWTPSTIRTDGGDESCQPCSNIDGCEFCNDYNGCAQCSDGDPTVILEGSVPVPQSDESPRPLYGCA